jgi:hypothetical protein
LNNVKRYQRNAKKRITTKLEHLAAAFLQQTGIKAEDACLRQTTSPEGVISVWFDRKDSVANLAESHADIEHIFSLMWEFHTNFGNFSMAEFRQSVAEVMAKYEQYFNVDKPKWEGNLYNAKGEVIDGQGTQDTKEAESSDQLVPGDSDRPQP